MRCSKERTKARIAALDGAPVLLTEAESALEGALDRLARFYDPAPGLAAFTRPGDADLLAVVPHLVPDPRHDPLAAVAFVVTLQREALLAMLTTRLRALYTAAPDLAHQAVPLAGRSGERRRLLSKVRDLEVREELLIVAAEDSGQTIDRRADVDPNVLFDAVVLEP